MIDGLLARIAEALALLDRSPPPNAPRQDDAVPLRKRDSALG
jgi:hypothetical protein